MFNTPKKVDQQAAWLLADAVSSRPDAVIGLSTGRTTGSIHATFVKLARESGLDCSETTFFGVDELYILGMSLSSATINDGIILDDEEMILITNYRKCLPEYQAIIQQIAGSPENQKKEKVSSSAG